MKLAAGLGSVPKVSRAYIIMAHLVPKDIAGNMDQEPLLSFLFAHKDSEGGVLGTSSLV